MNLAEFFTVPFYAACLLIWVGFAWALLAVLRDIRGAIRQFVDFLPTTTQNTTGTDVLPVPSPAWRQSGTKPQPQAITEDKGEQERLSRERALHAGSPLPMRDENGEIYGDARFVESGQYD